MRPISALFSGVTGFLAFALLAVTIGLNIWNIVIDAKALGQDESCSRPLYTFLIGSIVASAMALLAHLGGLGTVFGLVWAILGQIWYNRARIVCFATSPVWLRTTRLSLIVLWFNLASGLAFLALVCVAAAFGAA